jgi:hypothetical protein
MIRMSKGDPDNSSRTRSRRGWDGLPGTCVGSCAKSSSKGPLGFVPKRRNRPSHRRWKPDVVEYPFGILGIFRSAYADFEPKFAVEKLRERHGIDLAVEHRDLVTVAASGD